MTTAARHNESSFFDSEESRIASVRRVRGSNLDRDRLALLASLARETFGVESCVLNLVDETFEEAVVGAGPYEACGERSSAFCDFTIREDGCFVIEHAAVDPRFADNEKVTSGRVGFYAGVPVYGTDGDRVGAFCLRDPQPRAFGPEDRARLETFGRLVSAALRDAEKTEAAQDTIDTLNSLLDTTTNGVMVVSAIRDDKGEIIDFVIRYMNDRGCKIAGLDTADVTGARLTHLFPKAESRGFLGFYRRAREGNERLEATYPYSDDRLSGWYKVVAAPLRKNEVLATFEDISALRAAQDEAAQRQRTLENFIEHAPAAVAMFDRRMRYVAASRRWVTDYKLEHLEILGHSHYDIFPEITERWRAVHDRCLRGERVTSACDAFERLDGSVQWLRWEVRPWFDQSGDIGGVMMMTEDVTQRVRIDRERQHAADRLDLALQAGELGMWDWHIPSDTSHYSDTWFTMLGYAPGELPPTRETWQSLCHPEDAESIIREQTRHLLGETEQYESVYRMRHRDGHWIWVEALGRVMERDKRGDPVRMLGVNVNIHDRKQAEERAEQYAREMADALEQLDAQARLLRTQNEELRKAQERAEEAVAAKTAFLANMSHELRTPMTAIIGYAEMLGEEDSNLSEHERKSCESIHRNGSHLLDLVNDLLDLSKVDAEQLSVEIIAMDPRELLDGVCETLADRAHQKSVELAWKWNPEVPQMVRTDPTRLRQILLNIVGNAVKFTDEGGVTVDASCTLDDDGTGWMVIDVTDTGLGIAPDRKDDLFSPFRQADTSTTRRFGGTGLGLALSRKLATKLGGTLSLLRSTPDVGSTFRLRLPVTAGHAEPEITPDAAAEAAAAVEHDPIPMRDWRVLVAEDGVDNARLIRHVLERAGADVTIVGNGEEAVETVRSGQLKGELYTLIIMDLQMPVMDGCEATGKIRAMGCRVPMLALTASSVSSDRDRALSSGCDGYHPKPFRPSDLVRACVELVNEALHADTGEAA